MQCRAPRAGLILLFLSSVVLLRAEAEPGLVFSPAAWDCGPILLGTRGRITVTVTNRSAKEASVSFIPTCTCLAVEPASQAIAPGADARFTLSYDSKDVVAKSRTVVPDRKSFIVRSGLPGDTAPYYYFLTAAVHSRISEATAARPWVRGAGRGAIVTLSYWYEPACGGCNEFIGTAVPALEKELGIGIELLLKDPGVPLLEEELSRFLPQRSKLIPTYPVLKAGDTVIQGDAGIRERLGDILRAAAGIR
jgi:hypothetical protein